VGQIDLEENQDYRIIVQEWDKVAWIGKPGRIPQFMVSDMIRKIAKAFWIYCIGILGAITILAFFRLWNSDQHYAFKIITSALWKIGFIAFSILGIFSLVKANLRMAWKIIYIVLLIISFYGSSVLMNMAVYNKLPSALAFEKSTDKVKEGWQEFEKHEYTTAMMDFDRAIEIDSKSAPAYFGKAYIYSVQNQLDLAIQNYKTSIELDPKHADSYGNLGLAYLYENKMPEAIDALNHGEQLEPENGDIQANLAAYYLQSGDYSEAWERVHRAQGYGATVKPSLLSDLSDKMPEPNNEGPSSDGNMQIGEPAK
jgi:tetratricopeptide (TPR) repeat protein